MGISYCGLNCLECDIYKLKICSGCKIKKKDWGCHIRKCGELKKVPDCIKCDTDECNKFRRLIYKISRPLLPFDLEKNRILLKGTMEVNHKHED